MTLKHQKSKVRKTFKFKILIWLNILKQKINFYSLYFMEASIDYSAEVFLELKEEGIFLEIFKVFPNFARNVELKKVAFSKFI